MVGYTGLEPMAASRTLHDGQPPVLLSIAIRNSTLDRYSPPPALTQQRILSAVKSREGRFPMSCPAITRQSVKLLNMHGRSAGSGTRTKTGKRDEEREVPVTGGLGMQMSLLQ